jgi:hypothetical protein
VLSPADRSLRVPLLRAKAPSVKLDHPLLHCSGSSILLSRNDALGARPSGRRKGGRKAARGGPAGRSDAPNGVGDRRRRATAGAGCGRAFLRPEGRAPVASTAWFRLRHTASALIKARPAAPSPAKGASSPSPALAKRRNPEWTRLRRRGWKVIVGQRRPGLLPGSGLLPCRRSLPSRHSTLATIAASPPGPSAKARF